MPPCSAGRALLDIALLIFAIAVRCTLAFPRTQLHALREETREAFYHGWNSYMRYGFPDDEVTPLSCSGRARDHANPFNSANDVLGDFSLTLIDGLDTLVIMGDQAGFESAVHKIERFVQFDLPSRVQVFETTIRVLGGLLSGHIYASSIDLGHRIDNYSGSLLTLSVDLADRLLLAFDTPTGIPRAHVNLRDGPDVNETCSETCSAGAGSLVLEFATLTRLTGNDKYEAAARRAFFAVWDRRTALNLVGSSIDALSGLWLTGQTGIGASVDSFYEYALKASILLDDNAFLVVFASAYTAIKQHVLSGWIYQNVHVVSGEPMGPYIDALAAFFPGLQVLAGDLNAAIRHHLVYYKLWMSWGGIPERWNYHYGSVDVGWYGLRPEFVESNYLLYRATLDPFYLHVGAQILSDLQARARARCGYASIDDLRCSKLDDRMETFFISETVKYLYLLFDVDNPLNNEDSNFVFSTEGHPLRIDTALLNRTGNGPRTKLIPRPPSATNDTTIHDLFARNSPSATPLQPELTASDDNQDDDEIYVVRTSTCENFGQHTRGTTSSAFYSVIASWREFYSLDAMYNYIAVPASAFPDPAIHAKNLPGHGTTPLASRSALFSATVRANNATRRPIIDLPPVHPAAYSVALLALHPLYDQEVTPSVYADTLELLFSAESTSRLIQRGADLEAFSFDGHRVMFSGLAGMNLLPDEDVDDDAAPPAASQTSAGVKVLSIGNVPVQGNVMLQQLMSNSVNENEFFEILGDGRVKLRGREVLNLFIGGGP
ncbi:glycoside hydrolase [Limtongia smithiae]|uniref:glycoside hydrolase n=1 Tax=Limtongia smithiae TaxID=1125753 RepID=UPI0034CF3F05